MAMMCLWVCRSMARAIRRRRRKVVAGRKCPKRPSHSRASALTRSRTSHSHTHTPKWVEIEPNLVKIVAELVELAQTQPKSLELGRIRQKLREIAPNVVELTRI